MRKRKINEKKINELFNIYYKIVDYLSDQTEEFYDEQYNNLYECYVRFEKKISIENMKNVLFLNIYYKYKKNLQPIIEDKYFWMAVNNFEGLKQMETIANKLKL